MATTHNAASLRELVHMPRVRWTSAKNDYPGEYPGTPTVQGV